MKKLLLIITLAAGISFVSCNNPKSEGEAYAKQLDELCQQQSEDEVLALEDQIQQREQELAADSASLAQFQQALADAQQRNTAYIQKLKVKHGIIDADSAVNEVVESVINDQELSIDQVTSTIDAVMNE